MSNIFYAKCSHGILEWSNHKALNDYLASVEGKALVVKIDKEKGKRSYAQNDSLHLYYDLLAKELNDGGYSVQLVLKEVIDLEWDKEKIKELIWRPLQKALVKKNSTTDLDKVSDIDKIYEHLNRYVGEKFGIHVPFPSKDVIQANQINYPQENNKTEF